MASLHQRFINHIAPNLKARLVFSLESTFMLRSITNAYWPIKSSKQTPSAEDLFGRKKIPPTRSLNSNSKNISSSRQDDEIIIQELTDSEDEKTLLEESGLKPYPLLNRWLRFTSISHYLLFLHALGLICIQNKWFGLKEHMSCYLLGLLQIHPKLTKMLPYIQIISSSYHIIWRNAMRFVYKAFHLEGILILLRDKTKLVQQLQLDLRTRTNELIDSIELLGSSDTQFGFILVKSPFDNYLKDLLYIRLELRDHETFADYDCDEDEIWAPEPEILYLLRPNRHLQTIDELTLNSYTVTKWAITMALYAAATFSPLISPNIVTDRGYVAYRGHCLPDLLRLSQEGKLSRWSASIFTDSVRFLTVWADAWINTIIWSDNFIALAVPTTICIILMQDLIIYWRSINHHLELLLAQLRLRDDAIAQVYHPSDTGLGKGSYRGGFRAGNAFNPSSSSQILISSGNKLTSHGGLTKTDNYRLNLETQIVQHEIIDYFDMLKNYDNFVSIFITTIFIIWLFPFFTLSYVATKTDEFDVLLLIRFMQIVLNLALVIIMYFMPRVGIQNKRSYPLICAIMAIDKSAKRKESWLHIAEFFSGNRPSGFTFLHKYQLTWMTVLNFVTTCISFVVVIETFRHH